MRKKNLGIDTVRFSFIFFHVLNFEINLIKNKFLCLKPVYNNAVGTKPTDTDNAKSCTVNKRWRLLVVFFPPNVVDL